MRVPRAPRARLERDMSAGYARGIARLEQRVDAHCASEIVRRPLGGPLRAASCDLHCSIPRLSSDSRLRGGSLLPSRRSPPAPAGMGLRVIMVLLDLFYPSRRQSSAAFALVVDALRYRG